MWEFNCATGLYWSTNPKLHVLCDLEGGGGVTSVTCDLELDICWNVETKAIRPPKIENIAHISVRDFLESVFT